MFGRLHNKKPPEKLPNLLAKLTAQGYLDVTVKQFSFPQPSPAQTHVPQAMNDPQNVELHIDDEQMPEQTEDDAAIAVLYPPSPP